jgi:hypothetical protein
MAGHTAQLDATLAEALEALQRHEYDTGTTLLAAASKKIGGRKSGSAASQRLESWQQLAVYSKGEAIKDPATGEVLSYNEEKLGFLRVTEVNGRVSRAMPASAFATPLAVGSIVRPATQADVNALNKPSKRR